MRTPHFTLEELCRSEKAIELKIDNSLPETLEAHMRFTMAGLERIRAFLGCSFQHLKSGKLSFTLDPEKKKDAAPLIIHSCYRCPALNEKVGGSKTSQHLLAQAVDFSAPKFGSPREIFEHLAEGITVIGIDQLILEPGWVHVSFTYNPRYQILRWVAPGEYVEGLGEG